MKKIIGIYSITNPDGEIYIGCSKNIKNRWIAHKNRSRRGLHEGINLYKSFSDFGFKNHSFKILMEFSLEDIDSMFEYEKMYIKRYSQEGITLLNMTSGGMTGFIYSNDAKNKMKERWKK